MTRFYLQQQEVLLTRCFRKYFGLQKSIDNRFYRPKKDGGAVVMCEIQGAQEDFARRWERCFSDYPDLLTDAENKEQVQKYMERAIAYLQTVKARLDGGATH